VAARRPPPPGPPPLEGPNAPARAVEGCDGSEDPLYPRGPWWQRGWGAAAIGLLGLIAGLVLGALIGSSGGGPSRTVAREPGSTETETVRAKAPPPRTVTQTRVVVPANPTTVTVPASPPQPSSGSGRAYSGSGERNLGTLHVSHSSTIDWRAEGGHFSIENSNEDPQAIGLTSSRARGETSIEPGTYHEVTVNSRGPWSFTLTPG
jgi:hypothetical protein